MEPRTPNYIVLIQKADDVMVHAFLGDISGQLVEMVCDLTIGKLFQKNLGCLEAAFTGCKEEWCLFLKSKQKKKQLIH